MDWNSALWSFAGVVAGGVISFLVSRYYYQQASKELRKEAENLRKLNVLTIRVLEEANLLPENVKVTRDESGEPIGGFTYQLTGIAQARGSVSGEGIVTRQDDTDTPEQEAPSEEEGPRQE